MVCAVLSIDARGSDEGVIFLMTDLICDLSSARSCGCASSTLATKVRPVVTGKRRSWRLVLRAADRPGARSEWCRS